MKGTPPGTRLVLEAQATGLLDALVAYFGAAGVELPTRRYVAPGAPGLIAWDCDQVVVSLAQVGLGTAEDSGLRTPQYGAPAGLLVRFAQWSIQIVRCTPVSDDSGDPPSAEEIQDAGLAALVDAGLLSQFVTNTAEKTPDWLGPGGEARAGTVVSLGPTGRYHGYESTLTFSAMNVAVP